MIPSIDPETTVKDSSINKVLVEHRRQADGKVYFGQNAVIRHLPKDLSLNKGKQLRLFIKNDFPQFLCF